MDIIIFYLLSFSIIYLFYYLFLIKRKNSYEKIGNSLELKYLISKYKLNLKKQNLKSLSNKLALCNAFIISTVALVVSFLDKFIIKVLVGFVLLFPIILLTYHLLGSSLKKKEGKK